MSDLAKLVIKSYPEQGNLQLVCLRMPVSFACAECNGRKRSKLLTVVAADWNQLLCTECYEKRLADRGTDCHCPGNLPHDGP